jgi:hypothetical protein
MRLHRAVYLLGRTLTGFGSIAVSMYGLYVYSGANLNLDTLMTRLYCFVPLLSFPVFVLSFWYRRLSIGLHWAMAIVYLVVYSMLDWRTCSELGYCSGVLVTVLQTLLTLPALVTLAVAFLNLSTYRSKMKHQVGHPLTRAV